MAKLFYLPVLTRHDLPPDRLLEAAIGQVDGIVIMGYDKEGKEYFASSYADGGSILWLLEKLKIKLMELDNGAS